jgi:toxin ParE1/3/4
MALLKLTPDAKADLKEIGRYTEECWGVKQPNDYLAQLDSRLPWLGRNPQLGKNRDQIKQGYRSHPDGSQFVFYREAPGSIEILGILPQHMDEEKRLSQPGEA